MTREEIHLRDALGICACCADETVGLYAEICQKLRSKNWSWLAFQREYTESVAYALLSALDRAGVIAHGVAIRQPWLTDKWKARISGPTEFEKNNPGERDPDLDKESS